MSEERDEGRSTGLERMTAHLRSNLRELLVLAMVCGLILWFLWTYL
jgi:hypothetical protein